MPTPDDGHGIKNQFNQSTFTGPVTFEENVVIYQQEKRLPRRLTAIPILQSTMIGRDADLANLTRSLHEDPTVALIRGMGGVGKTTLATAYLQRELAGSGLTHAVWVQQTTDFATSLLATDKLPATLHVPITDNPVADARNLLRELSTLAGPSLLVIDNAEADLDQFLPYLPGAPYWKVLITSRITLRVKTNLPLDNLTTADGITLFRDHYKIETDGTTLRSIVTDVGGHALTIELLAKTAQKLHLPLARFYATLQQRGLAIDRRAGVTAAHAGTEEIPRVFPYLLAVFEMSSLPVLARRLLYRFTILPADFIAPARLHTIFQLDPDQEKQWDDFHHQLDYLTNAGWLARDEVRGYRIHQVVQQVVGNQPATDFSSGDLDNTLEGATNVIRFDGNQDNPAIMLDELAFGEAVLEKLVAFPENSKLSCFLDRLAALLTVFGRYREAAVNFEKALEIDSNLLGHDHPTVQVRRSNLANSYGDLGRYQEGAALLEKALKYEIAHFGEADPAVQTSRSNLSVLYRNLGKYTEGAELLEKALKYSIDHFSDDHPAVQVSRYNLASIYLNQGKFTEGAELMKKVIEHKIARFGDAHPEVQVVRSSLAIFYRNFAKYAKGAALLEKALEHDISHFGDAHPRVQIRRSNLANIYADQGKFDDAVELLEEALKNEIEHFSDTHPAVQTSRSNLAVVYGNLGEYEKGAELLEKALEYGIAHLGDAHPEIQIRRSNLANIYSDLDKPAEGMKLLERALKHQINHFGDAHPAVQISRSNLAVIYGALEKFAKGAELLEKALKHHIALLGDDHPEVQASRINLAVNQYHQEDYGRSLHLAQTAYNYQVALFGSDHPTVQSTGETLSVIREAAGE